MARAGGEIRFSELCRAADISKSTLDYNLTILASNGIITRDRGLIRLEYKTPLCYIFDSPRTRASYAYLGLLGERSGRSESETETAINLLGEEGFVFSRVAVVTTHRCAAEWEGVAPGSVDWFLLKDEEISLVEVIEARVEASLSDLLRNYVLIMDCTSATKPATIAYYRLATRHKIPLVYVYEKKKELTWIISREDLRGELVG
ncbi:MAG: hypothetical protein WED07_12760 [Candidatus Freyarchaeum deiterrae]